MILVKKIELGPRQLTFGFEDRMSKSMDIVFSFIEKEYQAKKKDQIQTVGIEFISTQIKMDKQIEMICDLIDAVNAEQNNKSIAFLNEKIKEDQQSLNKLLETFVNEKKKIKKDELKKITKILGWES